MVAPRDAELWSDITVAPIAPRGERIIEMPDPVAKAIAAQVGHPARPASLTAKPMRLSAPGHVARCAHSESHPLSVCCRPWQRTAGS